MGKFFAIVPIAFAIWGAHGLSAQDVEDPPAQAGRLSFLQGQVSLQPSGANQWSEASLNYPLAAGDRLYANQNGQAEVQIGEVVARLWHNTDLTMTEASDQMVRLGLAHGTLRLRTYGLPDREDVEVDTPNGAVTVIQPGDMRLDTDPGSVGTVVTVNTGQVQITGPGLSQFVNQGQRVRLTGSNPVAMSYVAMVGLDPFDNWSVERDHHILNSDSTQYVSRDIPGQEDLGQYGDWAPETDYGPVWYPRAVPAGWVPYRYGHWVWRGPWGWTWMEDEPWGYAPFHYGRWALIGNRWGWIPGPVVTRPVWSPALVVFVGRPGISAWFPLGPGESYRPWYRCSPLYINRVNITNIRPSRFVSARGNYNMGLSNIRYSYRTTAVTAVRPEVFASARPVNANRVHLGPRELAMTRIMARPAVRPTIASIPGRIPPVEASRVSAQNIQQSRVRTESRRPLAVPPSNHPIYRQDKNARPPQWSRREMQRSEQRPEMHSRFGPAPERRQEMQSHLAQTHHEQPRQRSH